MKRITLLVSILFPQLIWSQSTILKNVNIVDVINEQVNYNQTIEVKSGRIIHIHDTSYSGKEGDSVVDLSGKYVMPGLIDSHTHIEHSAYWNKELKYNPPREHLLELLNHALLGGVTTIREMACDVRVVGELSRAAQLNLIPSPDIIYPSVFAGPDFFKDPRSVAGALGETAGNTSWFRAIEDDTDIAQVIAEAKGNGSAALKLYALLNQEQINAITKEAINQDMMIWGHAFTHFAKPSEIITSGINDISHAPLLMYELSDKPEYASYTADDKRLDSLFHLMKSNNVSLDPTVFIFEVIPRLSDMTTAVRSITRHANEAGVRVIAGTDSISAYKEEPYPFIHNEIANYVDLCDFTTMEAIQSATINPAITLNLADEIGSVDIGKKANFIVLQRNPLEDIKNTRSIIMTIKDGIAYQRKE